MKKVFLLGIAFAMFICMLGCKKNENFFSCDPNIQEYALINQESNQEISRDSLANLPFEYQTAVFRSLNNENRLRIFKEKIDLVLNSILELNENEKRALLILRNDTPLDIYDYANDSSVVHPFIVNWEAIAREQLGWNDTAIEIYVSTWNSPSELLNKSYSPESNGFNESCACRSFWGCAGFGSCNWDSGCTETNAGCGIMGGAKCRGTCPEIVQPSGGSQIALSSRYDF